MKKGLRPTQQVTTTPTDVVWSFPWWRRDCDRLIIYSSSMLALSDRFPDEEGIATSPHIHIMNSMRVWSFPWWRRDCDSCSDTPHSACDCLIVSLMKKGLRLSCHSWALLLDSLIVSLMKKGLRHHIWNLSKRWESSDRFPDEEGIATNLTNLCNNP